MRDGAFRRISIRERLAKDLREGQPSDPDLIVQQQPQPGLKVVASLQTGPWRIHLRRRHGHRAPGRLHALKLADQPPQAVPRPEEAAIRRQVMPRRQLTAHQRTAAVASITSNYRYFLVSNSSSSGVRGQSSRKRRDSARSASSFPLVWQCGQ
jgi:hypothetical protein